MVMIKKKYDFALILFTALFVILLIVGCSRTGADDSNGTATVGYQEISAEQLKPMMDSDNNLLVVDVREKDEYRQGHLQGSVLIPMSEFTSHLNELPKEKEIVVVCETGARSAQVADYLVQQGYKQVYDLTGGLSAWPYTLVNE